MLPIGTFLHLQDKKVFTQLPLLISLMKHLKRLFMNIMLPIQEILSIYKSITILIIFKQPILVQSIIPVLSSLLTHHSDMSDVPDYKMKTIMNNMNFICLCSEKAHSKDVPCADKYSNLYVSDRNKMKKCISTKTVSTQSIPSTWMYK